MFSRAKIFGGLFHLDDDIDADDVLLFQALRRRFRQVQHQRQKRAVELEHVHAKAEGRDVGLARIADLAESQL